MLCIDQLWHSQDEADWLEMLESYPRRIKSPKFRDIEDELASLDLETIRSQDRHEWYGWLLHKYFPWKYGTDRFSNWRRLEKFVEEENGLDELYEIKERLLSFDVESISEGLVIASTIKGLGVAGASGLLALLYPAKFGTVDRFVVESLRLVSGLPESSKLMRIKHPEGLELHEGIMLVEIMRRKADELNHTFGSTDWTPRKIDMVLWTYRGNTQ